MRHQNQNNQDDQRSIGSIGYIGGNIGYMGSMTMEYPYDHPNSHFQLWKPFFPRGEAPPPYEEAITMAQSDMNNPQGCTVSVATSTHRTIPINVCNSATTENNDLSTIPASNNNMNNNNNNNNPITSNTTNLINININNAGNITAVATGENHLIQSNGNYLSATPTNTLPRNGSNNQIMEQDLVNRNIAYAPTINNCNTSEIALSSSSIREIPCTLQNCDLNTSCSLIRSSSSLSSNGGGIVGITAGCYSAPSTMKMNQQNQTSNQSLAQILATNQSTQSLYEQYIDCLNAGAVSQTILPPPLFDTNCTTTNINQCYEVQSHPGNYCTLSAIDLPKNSTHNGSKRLHRTIPKHFTMSSSPSSSSTVVVAEVNATQSANQIHHQTPGGMVVTSSSQQQQQQQQNLQHRDNKKSSCQCPVQHVPMNYMQFPNQNQSNQQQQSQPEIQTQQQFAQQQRHQHSIYMSGSKKHNVIKSTTFPSTINTTTVGAKIQTITTSELMGITNAADVMQNDMSGSIISSGGSGTLRRSQKSSLSSINSNNQNLAMPTTPNKKSIATISVATSISSATSSTTTPTYYTPKIDVKHHQQQQQQQIHSILKNKKHCSVNVINVVDGGNEQNPILPPKLYKTTTASNLKYSSTPPSSGQSTPGGSKQIHTISRPNELTSSNSQFSLLAITNNNSNNGSGSGGGSSKYHPNYQQPTQLRTNIQGTLYNTKTLPRGGGSSSHGSENVERAARSSNREQQQQNQMQSTSNYSINTLPKNHQQQSSQPIYGKVSNPSRSVLNDVVNKVPSVIMLPLPQQQQMNIKSAPGTPSSFDKKHSSNAMMEGGDVASSGNGACQSLNSTLKRHKSRREAVNANEKVISSKGSSSSMNHHERASRCDSSGSSKCSEKPLPVLTTTTNCVNPKEHFLPNEASLDDDYLSECENCKAAGHGSRYYLNDEELDELPLQETMTLQRKMMNENDESDLQNYYRVSSTLPTNTNKKIPVIKSREPWFSTIPASSSSDEETVAE